MKRKILSTFVLILFTIGLYSPANVFAAPTPPDGLEQTGASCEGSTARVQLSWNYDEAWDNSGDNHYRLKLDRWTTDQADVTSPYTVSVPQDTSGTWELWRDNCKGTLCFDDESGRATGTYRSIKCSLGDPGSDPLGPGECRVTANTIGNEDNPELISLTIDTNGRIITDRSNPDWFDKYNVQIRGVANSDDYLRGKDGPNKFEFHNYPNESSFYGGSRQFINSNGVISIPSINWGGRVSNDPNGNWDDKNYEVVVREHRNEGGGPEICSGSFTLGEAEDGKCNGPEDCFSGICNTSTGECGKGVTTISCNIANSRENSKGEITKASYICQTAIGPISADAEGFSRSILRLVMGIAGGILVLLIIINGYKLMTSQGDPEKLKDARDGIIAAIAGILLIIFSLSILQLITVDIIGIPGFR